MKSLKIILFFLLVFAIDQIIFFRYFPISQFSLLIPIVLILSLKLDLKKSLIAALIFGLLFDLSLLDRYPVMIIFLVLETLGVYILKKKFIDQDSFLAVLSIAISFQLLFFFFFSMIFTRGFSINYLGVNIAANLVLSSLVIIIFQFLKKYLNQYER